MTTHTSDDSLSTAVLVAVADREGVHPTELEEFHHRIDPDALDALFNDTSGRVTFEYHGYIVTVDSDGHVDLTDAHVSE